MATARERDLELWKAWRKSGSQADLSALYKQMDGLIHKECGRWSGVIAPQVLELEAARLAKQAFESYDPKAGAALSTHVTNYLQKISRTVYTSQNVARIPEYQTLKINGFMRAHSELEGIHGRPPTSAELAAHLQWTPKAVENFRKNMRKEEMESVALAAPGVTDSGDEMMINLIYHDLTPTQKVLFEHTTGYGGAEVLDGKGLMAKLKMTQGQLSYEKTKMIDFIKKRNGGNG